MARIRPARNNGPSKDDGGDTPPAPPARARRSGSPARGKQPASPKPARQGSGRTKAGSVTKEVQDQRRGSRFVSDVIAELRKVQWPTRSQLAQSTAVVILVVAVVTIYLDLVDNVVSRVIHAIL